MQITQEQGQCILDLARATIYRTLGWEPPFARGQTDPIAYLLAAEAVLDHPAGCFVSLHQFQTHKLRGCVGRLDAREPLRGSLTTAAMSVLEDPRFADDPVRIEELPELELEVSVLSPLMAAASPLAFDLLNDGIMLRCGRRSGCFLPQVARETGWNKEQLLDRLCTEKMGLPRGSWRKSKARLSVFTTVTVGPEQFVISSSINTNSL
jgi:AmmeMemoRadiSam system protein A